MDLRLGIRLLATAAVAALAPPVLTAQQAANSTSQQVAEAPVADSGRLTPATCEEQMARAVRRRRAIVRVGSTIGAGVAAAFVVTSFATAEYNMAGPLPLLWVLPIVAVPGAAAGWLVTSLATPVPEAAKVCAAPTAAPSP